MTQIKGRLEKDRRSFSCDWSAGICKRTYIKEAREHPTLPKATVRRIVKDHLKMK